MSDLFGVGQSKVRAWRNCRRAYWWKYVRQLQRRTTKRPFMFGKIVHRMIEAHAQGEDPNGVLDQISFDNEKLFTAEREMYGDIVEDIRTIMAEYFVYHGNSLRMIPVPDEEDGLRFAEHEFAVPLEELVPKTDRARVQGIVFKGQVDGLAKTRANGLRWLMETKTHDNKPGEDERWRNVQTIVYRRVVLHLEWVKTLDGVCWNYIKSKPPTRPQVLKDGSRLSAQKVTTLPSVVREVLREAGLREEDHDEILQRAVESRRDYFDRIFSPVSEIVADNVFRGFVDTACEMRDDVGKWKRDMNVGRHCSWCDYEPLCRTELTGGDVDFVAEREYSHEDPEGYRRSGRKSQGGGEDAGGTADPGPRGKRVSKLRVLRPERVG